MWTISSGQPERRDGPREIGPFPAVIRLYNGRLIPSAALNLSERGAKLALSKEESLPKEFELTIPAKNTSWRVRLVWQQGKELGVYRV
jgi:hypothetical protein